MVEGYCAGRQTEQVRSLTAGNQCLQDESDFTIICESLEKQYEARTHQVVLSIFCSI